MAYKRTINYIQVPIFAHLAWGRETRGLNIFVNAGPQFGLYLSDSQKTNFDGEEYAATDRQYRVSPVMAQDTMAVRTSSIMVSPWVWVLSTASRRWGISWLRPATTMDWEISTVSSKRDYFGKSNYGQIVLKLSYLFDITRTKNVKRK